MLKKTVTESFATVVHGLKYEHLTDRVIQRSKRMILDTLGVGLLGSNTEVAHKVMQYSKVRKMFMSITVWGHSDLRLPPQYAAFVNGVAVHSMDFDDTWHPATHPSGAVLPALIALVETLPQSHKLTGQDLLLAFNVGIEVQGQLLRFSNEASYIPKRFHPPAVVGTMGSAAATAKFLRLGPSQCRNALAIASSFAGAPLANAATQTKPLHIGNAARHGLEAAHLALLGLKGNTQILDIDTGFGAFYTDYTPKVLPDLHDYRWLLDDQNVAIKRFPAHLGMHWVADAATSVRKKLLKGSESYPIDKIIRILLKVPDVKYVNRPFPCTEHEARHSFQFNACTALLDGDVSVQSFTYNFMNRPQLKELLTKIQVEHPPDNKPSFDKLYCEVCVMLDNGDIVSERCNTFYGHWRKPLSMEDLVKKFKSNASTALTKKAVEGIIETIDNLEEVDDCSALVAFLQFREQPTLDYSAMMLEQ
ncbi:cis-aconitate decarboxylase [Latimeria chalumnae]|uniref:cis-aconitate decarboxylase n=1 Tax=Latimeria chalumnae TaxID=7897 RepID=UPI00313DF3E6